MSEKNTVSIKTLSEYLGVSTATVSRVMNNADGVSPETAARVRQAAQEMGYVPNAMARGLRTSSLPLVGIIVPDIINEFFSRIVLNVQLALAQSGYSVFICNTDESHELEQSYLSSLQTLQIRGLICISGYDLTDENWPDVPTVYIDRDPAVRVKHSVSIESDNENGGYQAGRELLRRGCRRPAMLEDDRRLSTAVSRESGFLNALEEAGIKRRDVQILTVERVDERHAYDAVSFALRSGARFDGLFCCTDWLALGAIRALQNAHKKVPDEVKVVGYDDISMASYCALPITTVHQDVNEMSRIAVEELRWMMEGKQSRRTHWVVPVTLVRREST